MTNGPNLLHNPHSPDVFADAASGFFTFNGCMRITFESLRSDYTQAPPSADRVTIGRLVMPLPAAEAMALGILRQVEAMRVDQKAEQNATLQ